MANRRMFTGYGNDQGSQPRQHAYTPSADTPDEMIDPLQEAHQTFRRRVTPVTGFPEPRPSTMQEVLALLRGNNGR